MTQTIEQYNIDTKHFDHEVIDCHQSKSGWFIFDNSDMTITVSFKADENGNFISLSAIDEDDNEFVINDDNRAIFEDQILNEIGEDESYKNYTDHGMTNADFLFGFSA